MLFVQSMTLAFEEPLGHLGLTLKVQESQNPAWTSVPRFQKGKPLIMGIHKHLPFQVTLALLLEHFMVAKFLEKIKYLVSHVLSTMGTQSTADRTLTD